MEQREQTPVAGARSRSRRSRFVDVAGGGFGKVVREYHSEGYAGANRLSKGTGCGVCGCSGDGLRHIG